MKNIEEIKKNTTLLIAGPLNPVSLFNAANYLQFCNNIIISGWLDFPEQYSSHANREKLLKQCLQSTLSESDLSRVHLCLAPSPSKAGVANPMFNHYLTLLPQVVGILNGIEYSVDNFKNKYLIRTRSDEYFTDLNPLIKIFAKDSDKVTFGNVVWRTDQKEKWNSMHVGDHLFMSNLHLAHAVYRDFYKMAFVNRPHVDNCECILASLFNIGIGNGAHHIENFSVVEADSLGSFQVSVAGTIYNNETTLDPLYKDFKLMREAR